MSGAGRFLVIDDEKSIRVTLVEFLNDRGHEAESAGAMSEALSRMAEREFDVLFVDILLGVDSGLRILQHVTGRGLGCLVVMITGEPNLDTATEALRLGAFDYLVKPVRQEELLRVADLALRHKRLRDEKLALEKEKDRYRANLEAIFKSVREAIVTIDTDMAVVNANRAAEAFFSAGAEAMRGRSLYASATESQKSCLAAILEKTLAARIPFDEYAVEWVNARGGHETVILNSAPLFGERGEFSGAVLTVRQLPSADQVARFKGSRSGFDRMIGRSEKMQAVYRLVEALASTDTTVLVTGESGTGKELVADALHSLGSRSGKPLIKVNCSALSENLLESELFGHVRGAFTGAIRDKFGRFQLADGGTMFLDEIADISPAVQLKLLRVLQEKRFERVGDATPLSADVRLIAATNQRLYERVSAGAFREDLYYRIKVVEVMLPPLRERADDIPLLVDHFIGRYNATFKKSVRGVSRDVLDRFMAYGWPGNIRELEHALEHAFVKCSSPIISLDHLPQELQAPAGPAQHNLHAGLTREAILAALHGTDWNIAKAARRLTISRQHLYRKMEQLAISITRE